ncbi:MAG: glycosyltransferase family 2 protein [Alistipes sp.]|nr:glycosyltransferase family 2 protein [Alistipes sp.]
MLKLSVVILNWNGRKHLERYLPSVVQHTVGEGVEVVVADNGSTDDSLAWLQMNYPDVRVVRLDKNYGFAEGYNRALQQIDAEYYLLLNSDVEVTAGWWQPLVDMLDRNRDLAVVAPKLLSDTQRDRFEYAGASGGFIDYLGYPFCRGRILSNVEQDNGQYDDARDIFWASGAAMCCRSEVFHDVGGFDVDFFAHMEEIDLQWRMQLGGWRIAVEPKAVVYHLGGGTLPASPMKIYLNHRNNLAMLYKCASRLQRLVVAVVRPFTDMAEVVLNLLLLRPRRAWAVLRAWGSFIKWHGALSKKRKAVKRVKKVKHIYRGSIVLRYLLGSRDFNNMM